MEKNNQLLMGLFPGVLNLHEIYHVSVATEDIDKWVFVLLQYVKVSTRISA